MKELYDKWINKKAHVKLNGLDVGVVVLDIKASWGKTKYKVSPVVGKGEIWVENITN